jgi:amidophosphoribosyltransferase
MPRVSSRIAYRPHVHFARSNGRQEVGASKLNAVDLEFKGKTVLLVDDSVVRGATFKRIVQIARNAAGRKVYFASSTPTVRYPNVYGIDMPAASDLVAHGRIEDEVRDIIGAHRRI